MPVLSFRFSTEEIVVVVEIYNKIKEWKREAIQIRKKIVKKHVVAFKEAAAAKSFQFSKMMKCNICFTTRMTPHPVYPHKVSPMKLIVPIKLLQDLF